MQSIFHWPEQIKIRKHQIQTIQWVCWDSQHHCFQTGMRPGVNVLPEKECLLLWPDSGSLSLQFSQHHSEVVTVDGLSGFQEIQKDHLFSVPTEDCLEFFFFSGVFIWCHSMDCHILLHVTV